MLPFLRPSCYFKTRPPSCALGTSFYTVSEGRDLMTYVSDNYTSYSAPSPLKYSVPTNHWEDTKPCSFLSFVKTEIEPWLLIPVMNRQCIKKVFRTVDLPMFLKYEV